MRNEFNNRNSGSGSGRNGRSDDRRGQNRRGGDNRGRKKFGGNRERREGDNRRDERGGNRERREDNRGRKNYTPGRGEKPWQKREGNDRREERGGNRERRDDNRSAQRGRKNYSPKREEKPWQKSDTDKIREQRGRYGDRRSNNQGRSNFKKHRDTGKPWEKRESGREDKFDNKKRYDKRDNRNFKRAFAKTDKPFPKQTDAVVPADTGLIRLNKYLANAGICSRREADTFIEAGTVTVNGKIITQLGYKVSPGDKVHFGGNPVRREKTVYILLNKPKGYITTTDDERDRATVMELVEGVEERIYPVGRLDRNTSGLLLLTNDGELAKILMHPKYNVPKVYHVILDSVLKPDHIDLIRNGIELEDGFIKPDDIAYVDGAETKKEVGIEIHSGKNRIVRRIFEHFGYNIVKLDRVLYAGLTKKNLSRGKWRFLAENEVRMLKRFK